MKATAGKTSLKNKRYLRNVDYFAIVVFCSHSVLFSDKLRYRWTGRSIVELNIENESLLLYVHVVVKTLNLEISRCRLAD